MSVKRLAALGLLFTLATCSAFACKAKTPAPPQDFDATAADASTDVADEGDAGPSQPDAGTACIVYPDILKSSMAAVGGSGTGLAQDATVQQIIKLYGASIPQGGSGTGLCQDASLQALYLLIAAQLDAGSGSSVVQLDGNVIGPSNNNQVVKIQNQPVAAGSSSGQVWIFNGTNWVPGFASIDAGSIQLAGDVNGAANNNAVWYLSGDGGATLGILPSNLTWAQDAGGPTLTVATPTVDVPTNTVTIQGQNAFDGGANTKGGDVLIQAGLGASGDGGAFSSGNITAELNAPNTGGTERYFIVNRNGTVMASFGALTGNTSAFAIYGPSNTVMDAGTANYILEATSGSGNLTAINGPVSGHVRLQVNGVNEWEVTGGYTGFVQPAGGFASNNAFSWESTSVTLTSSSSNVLTATQYANPHIKFTGTLTGTGTTVTFPATDGACWDLDFSAIVTITDSIALIANSNTWSVAVASVGTEFPHICYSAGVGRLVGVSMIE